MIFQSIISNQSITVDKLLKKSANCMCLLGGLYLQGYIFPRNLIRARICFEKAALNGSIKAKIIDSMIRKHPWRLYLSDVSIQAIYNTYILIFDEDAFLPNYAKHIVFHTNNESLHQRIASAISLLKPTKENPSQSITQRGYLET